MYRHIIRAVVLGLAAAALGLLSSGARAAAGACDPQGNNPAFALAARALTGPGGGDLTVTVTGAAPGCTAPDSLKKIQVKTYGLDDSLASTKNVADVSAAGGVATIDVGTIERGQRIAAEVLVQSGDPERTYVLRTSTKALLRPELVTRAARGEVLKPPTFK